jgi:hypothetical protein
MASEPNELLASLDRKLSALIHLTAYQIVVGKTVAEAAPILKRLGLTNAEIAQVFDSTPNAVKVRLYEGMKKKQKKS